MSVSLPIQDQIDLGKVVSSRVLKFPVNRVTVKELIETRVSQEIESFMEQSSQPFLNIIKPGSIEGSLNNSKYKKKVNFDIKAQQNIAINAFENNGYFILFNDRQLTELEDIVHITPNSKVVFFKLTAIVGG